MKRQNFTLVELLTVIAVIAILAGILLPALGMVKESAKLNKALTEAKSIHMAIKSFYNDYKYLPAKDASGGKTNDVVICNAAANTAVGVPASLTADGTLHNDYLKLFDVLCCSSTVSGTAENISDDALKFNSAKKKYLTPAKDYYSSDASSKGYRDPWGRPYIIYLDTNYDGKIENVNSNFKVPNNTVVDIVAVVSLGRNGETIDSKIKVEDLAASWQ